MTGAALGAGTRDPQMQVWAEGYYAGYQQGCTHERENNKMDLDAALGL